MCWWWWFSPTGSRPAYANHFVRDDDSLSIQTMPRVALVLVLVLVLLLSFGHTCFVSAFFIN